MSPEPTAPPARARTVLLVDDVASLRFAMRQALEQDGGWEVVGTASNGVEALRTAAALRPDVVVLDHQMPLLTGLEVLPDLRRSCPDALIVMYTSSTELTEQATAEGADAVVDKAQPFEDVLDALRALAPAGA